MLPPSSTCEALYRLHPQLRLAWAGRKRAFPSELNAGSFCIVQLYDISDCGGEEDSFTFREFWNSTVLEQEDGTSRRVKVSRGPIFNRQGGTSRDWDPLFRFPIFVIELSDTLEYPWGEKLDPIYDVFSGKIVHAVRHWLKPIEDRVVQTYVEKGKTVSAKCDAIGDRFGDRLWKESKQTGAVEYRNLAYKHIKSDIAKQDEKNSKDPIKEYYRPPKMPSSDLKRARH